MFTLSCFIDECRIALEKHDSVYAIQEIIADVVLNPDAIEAVLGPKDDSNVDNSAQYLFLHQSPDLTVLKVVMPSKHLSPPHNHLIWAVIGLYRGRENNIFYRREGDSLVEIGRRSLDAPEVMVLKPDTIHSISNPSAQPSYALHVYGGMLTNPARSLWNPFTLEEEPFQVSALQKYEQEMAQRVFRTAT